MRNVEVEIVDLTERLGRKGLIAAREVAAELGAGSLGEAAAILGLGSIDELSLYGLGQLSLSASGGLTKESSVCSSVF